MRDIGVLQLRSKEKQQIAELPLLDNIQGLKIPLDLRLRF